jgi:hypothetical protein
MEMAKAREVVAKERAEQEWKKKYEQVSEGKSGPS